jgi:AmmeMemoRadiSam system protein A
MDKPLTAQQQTTLLAIARKAIETCVLTGKPTIETTEEAALNARLGCFVSIKQNGQLRGCIGKFQPQWQLYQEVAEMACAAATQDPRFYPMGKDDLDNFLIEISVLSPLEKITDPNDIQVGSHGIYLEKGSYRGVLLPQVAVEHQWDRSMFLRHTCIKAGLPTDAWQSEGTDIFIFTAQVFAEADLDNDTPSAACS